MKQLLTRGVAATVLLASILLSPLHVQAEVTNLADVPLANAPSDAVLPNLMYILDDSSSMQSAYMPNEVVAPTVCKTCSAAGACFNNYCTGSSYDPIYTGPAIGINYIDPPFFAAEFNQIYYNPDITYAPGVTSTGVSMPSWKPNIAPDDAYNILIKGTTTNLTGAFPETYYCNSSGTCRRNGIDNVQSGLLNYFLYYSTNATAGTPLGGYPSATFFKRTERFGAPYYFTISSHEYCSDQNLVNCSLANADGTAPSGFTFPAPLRYCRAAPDFASTSVVSDAATSTAPRCRKKYDASTYQYARYGRFRRVDIIPAKAPFVMRATSHRVDCASTTSCTYEEEIQNFSNWYSYYRFRMNMMKTASGRAFLSIDDRYRVGFITINPGSPVSGSKYLPLSTFNAAQKNAFYTKLYAQDAPGSTPLRQALARVGRHFAGVTSGINQGMPQDPIQFSCQQNFALLTSDGYWNDTDPQAVGLTNTAVGNQDNVANTVNPFFVARKNGTLDGVGTKTTNVQPTTIVEQVLCSANGLTAFSAGTQTPCGCRTGQTRIWERTVVQTSSIQSNDDVPTSQNVSVGTATFRNVTGACSPTSSTVVTPVTKVEQQVVAGTTTTTFAPISGATGTANAAGSCGSTLRRAMQRTTTWNSTVVYTDGVAAAPVVSNVQYVSIVPIGNCAASAAAAATTQTNGTAQTTNVGQVYTNADIILNPNPTVTPGVTAVSSTPGGTANTLADVAMYYYKTDLRTSGALALDNVPTSPKDITPTQHMVTFTLGLGLIGLMDYIPNYETSATGDFAKIKSSSGGCSWTTGTCNWPTPVSGLNTTLDDLWHAAVNGRGTYYSASDPNTLADGLGNALAALKIQTAAASASATSSPNITKTDNNIYSSTFRTVKWDGEIAAQKIDPETGEVLAAITWSAQALLDAKVAAATDTRTIYTFSAATGNKLKPFLWGNLTSGEQNNFKNKCAGLSQPCPASNAQRDMANDGQNMVNYLRGQKQYEGTFYRARDHVLGDSVNAAPVFVREPRFSFNDAVTPTYGSFKTNNATRQGVLYVAANDGMLHAFNGDTGQELWAYVPGIVFSKLFNLASENWDVHHQFLVDGSPQVMDVFDSGASAWKTILIAGLNKGGRGYYALDVTDPANPKGLWEACASDANASCAISDDDFGLSYGYPILTKRASDGRWVALVTSGMNNVSPGSGHGYLFVLDALTGQILKKVDTGAGDTTTPAGFARISGFANNFSVDNTGTYVYGGDLLGNLWRFDMSTATPTVLKLAMLKDAGGKPQSITTRPELTTIAGARVVYVGTGRYLGPDDLSDPATLSPPLQWSYQQSFYAIKDRDVALGSIRTSSPGLVKQTLTTTSLTTRSTSKNAVDWTGRDGWYVDFNPGNTSAGERVNIDPQLVAGTLIVATAVPNDSVCAVGGDSWLYFFDYKSGQFVATSPGQIVAQKYTGKTIVGIVIIQTANGAKGIVTDSSGGKTSTAPPPNNSQSAGKRVMWREIIQ